MCFITWNNYKHTCDTHFQGVGFSHIMLPFRHLSTDISTRPPRVWPIQMTGGWSLHEAVMLNMIHQVAVSDITFVIHCYS